MESFLRYRFGGPIFGGAYFRNFTVFFAQTNQTWICYVKRNYCQKCVIFGT